MNLTIIIMNENERYYTEDDEYLDTHLFNNNEEIKILKKTKKNKKIIIGYDNILKIDYLRLETNKEYKERVTK